MKLFLHFIFLCTLPFSLAGQISDNLKDTVIMNLKEHVTILTSKEFQGRGIDNGGADLAAEYLYSCFNNYDLNHHKTKEVDSIYFQNFIVANYGTVKEESFVEVDGKKFYSGKDFVTLGFGGVNSNDFLNGRRSFLITRQSDQYFVLSSKKIQGEIRLSYNNKQFLSACRALGQYELFVRNNPLFTLDSGKDSLTFKMVASTSLTRALTKYISKKQHDKEDSVTVCVIRDMKPLKCKNVIGYIPAKTNIDSTIVITAHYDHLGIINGTHFPGANDNASGVSVMLELARLLADKHRFGWSPSVNLVFIAFSAEESGLLGSGFFVDNPTIDLAAIKYVLNLDMVGGVGRTLEGQPEMLYLYSSNCVGHDVIDFLVDGAEKMINLSFNLSGNPKYLKASDQANFIRKGIPSLFIFSGVDKNSHKPTDTKDYLSFEKMADLTLLLRTLLVE